MMRTSMACMLLVMSLDVGAAGVYKWTDAEGNVHFTTTPPPAAAGSEEQVATHTIPPAEDLRPLMTLMPKWAWKGERDGWEIRVTFNERGYYIETLRRPLDGRYRPGGRSYLGKWRIENRTLIFSSPITYGTGADALPPPGPLDIDFYREGVLKVRDARGQPAYFRQEVGSSKDAFPVEYR